MSELPALLFDPNIRIYGSISDATVTDFLAQLGEARRSAEPIVLELTTLSADADAAKRIALEIRLCRKWGKVDMSLPYHGAADPRTNDDTNGRSSPPRR